jgi:CAAX protease family protein
MKTQNEILIKVITFLLIIISTTSGIYFWMFNGAKDSTVAVFLMMYTPGISAIITAIIFKDKIKDFGWKLSKQKYLLFSYSIPIIVSLIGYGIVWMTKYSGFSPQNIIQTEWAKMIGFELPVPFVVGVLSKMIIYSLIAIFFVFGEEVGWSGFLTPNLRKIYSVPVTSIIVGFFWAAWHYPAIIGGFYGPETPLWIALPGFTMVMIGASFFRTILVDRSKNLWVGVLLHTSHNVILMEMFLEMTIERGPFDICYLVSETGIFLGFVYIITAIIYWRVFFKTRTIKPI